MLCRGSSAPQGPSELIQTGTPLFMRLFNGKAFRYGRIPYDSRVSE